MSSSRLAHFALGVLVAGALWELRRHAAMRRRARDQALCAPTDEQTWEGEGGALPDTGSQLGPAEPCIKKT